MSNEIELTREHQKLSVKPTIWVSQEMIENSSGYQFGYSFTNNGLGPAVFKSFSLNYKNKPMANWQQLLVAIAQDYPSESNFSEQEFASLRRSLPMGYVLPAGETFKPLVITNAPEAATLLFKAKQNINIQICYCSMYQECWNNTGFDVRPEKLPSCKSHNLPFDSGFFQSQKPKPKMQNPK